MVAKLKSQLEDALQGQESYKSLVQRIQQQKVVNEEFNSPFSFGDQVSPHKDLTCSTAKICHNANGNKDKENPLSKSKSQRLMHTQELAIYNEQISGSSLIEVFAQEEDSV